MLDGMVLARLVVENDSIVQNFQSVAEKLNYCVGGMGHLLSHAVRSSWKSAGDVSCGC